MKTLYIHHRTFINAVPDDVYEAIATGAGWDAWLTQGTTVDARPGGTIHFRIQDFEPDHITLEDEGTVLEVNPGLEMPMTLQYSRRTDNFMRSHQ